MSGRPPAYLQLVAGINSTTSLQPPGRVQYLGHVAFSAPPPTFFLPKF